MAGPVETILWDAARSWRTPGAVVVPDGVDWERVLEVAAANRAAPLLHRALRGGERAPVPDTVGDRLGDADERADRWVGVLADDLRDYLRAAASLGVDTIVMKGLALGHEVYGDPGVRPGVDIDLLVPEDQVEAALAALETIGFGRYWPNLLEDGFYRRHHLHIERCSEDWMRWFEVHWALDHPATPYLIDYGAIFARSSPATLVGQPVRRLSAEDLLISLAVHLVKHAVYLPAATEREDLDRVILADGVLLLVLDVAEVVRHGPGIDWARLVRTAVLWRAAGALHAALRTAQRLLGSDIPPAAMRALAPPRPGAVTGTVLRAVADAEVRDFDGRPPRRGWRTLVGHRGGLGLRPVRLLGALDYLRPGPDYLRARYGDDRLRTAVRHSGRGLWQYGRLAVEAGVASRRRDRRLRADGQYEAAKAHLDLGP